MKTADPELMRAINRFHVMDAIRRFGPVSRVEISQLTELSPTTVSAITAALLDDRLIIPLQLGAVRDAARGRPRVMLKLNPDAAHVVGVKLAPDQITVAVTNFCADVLRTLALPIRIDRQTAAVIADLVEDGVRRCVSDADLEMSDISGVCVGLPGVVERAAGVCRQSPIFSERDVPFGADLSAAARRARRRSTATSISSRSPSTGSARRATSTTFSSSTSSAASASASCTTANCFAARTVSAPTSATSWSARRAAAAGGSPTSASEASVLGEAEALLRGGEAMSGVSRRPRHGAAVAARRRRRCALRRACSLPPARRSASPSPI